MGVVVGPVQWRLLQVGLQVWGEVSGIWRWIGRGSAGSQTWVVCEGTPAMHGGWWVKPMASVLPPLLQAALARAEVTLEAFNAQVGWDPAGGLLAYLFRPII